MSLLHEMDSATGLLNTGELEVEGFKWGSEEVIQITYIFQPTDRVNLYRANHWENLVWYFKSDLPLNTDWQTEANLGEVKVGYKVRNIELPGYGSLFFKKGNIKF